MATFITSDIMRQHMKAQNVKILMTARKTGFSTLSAKIDFLIIFSRIKHIERNIIFPHNFTIKGAGGVPI